jgi:hypothetical protein
VAAARRESPQVRDAVRTAVRAVLRDTPAFTRVPPEERKALANKLVNVGLVAARLAEGEDQLTREISERSGGGVVAPIAQAQRAPIAQAQSASDQLGMAAVREAGRTVQSLRDSVAFPEFVQSLITGTFQAILTSSTAQLGSLGELLDNVAATSDEFDGTIQDGEVRSWAVQRFPFLAIQEGAVTMRDPEADIHDHDTQLRGALSAAPEEIGGIDGSDIEGTLLPLVRRKLGRDRQGILATLVQMGLQRIVVDEGRLEASMDLRVDAQSASQENQQALDSLAVTAGASANMMFGPVGASAYASTSIGRVRSDVQQTSEQIAARAGLRSSVQLAFRTEQVPLDRMANAGARVRISQNARVPDVAAGSILDPLQPQPPVRTAPAIPPTPPTAPSPPPTTPSRPPTPPSPPPTASSPPPTTPSPPPTASSPPPTASSPPPTQPTGSGATGSGATGSGAATRTAAPSVTVPPPPAAPTLPTLT